MFKKSYIVFEVVLLAKTKDTLRWVTSRRAGPSGTTEHLPGSGYSPPVQQMKRFGQTSFTHAHSLTDMFRFTPFFRLAHRFVMSGLAAKLSVHPPTPSTLLPSTHHFLPTHPLNAALLLAFREASLFY